MRIPASGSNKRSIGFAEERENLPHTTRFELSVVFSDPVRLGGKVKVGEVSLSSSSSLSFDDTPGHPRGRWREGCPLEFERSGDDPSQEAIKLVADGFGVMHPKGKFITAELCKPKQNWLLGSTWIARASQARSR